MLKMMLKMQKDAENGTQKAKTKRYRYLVRYRPSIELCTTNHLNGSGAFDWDTLLFSDEQLAKIPLPAVSPKCPPHALVAAAQASTSSHIHQSLICQLTCQIGNGRSVSSNFGAKADVSEAAINLWDQRRLSQQHSTSSTSSSIFPAGPAGRPRPEPAAARTGSAGCGPSDAGGPAGFLPRLLLLAAESSIRRISQIGFRFSKKQVLVYRIVLSTSIESS